MRKKSSKKDKVRNNPFPRSDYVLVEKEELERLIRAKAERDILLGAYASDDSMFHVVDIAESLCKINGIEVKAKDA